MKVMTTGSLVTCALAIGTFSGGANAAQSSIGIGSIETHPTPGIIEIESDGAHYVGPVGGSARLDTEVDLAIEGRFSGRIKRWSVELLANSSATSYPVSLRPLRSESYPRFHRPKDIVRTLDMSFDFAGYGTDLCNAMAGELRRVGFSNEEIFAENRRLSVALSPRLDYTTTIALGFSDSTIRPGKSFALDCLAHRPEPPEPEDDGPTRVVPPGIVFADLALRYDDQPTECPTDVTAEASFAGDAPGTFVVRFHEAFGGVSQPLELTLTEGDFDGTHYVSEFRRDFRVGPSSGGSATGIEMTIDDELVPVQREEELVGPSTGSPSPLTGAPGDKAEPNHDPDRYASSVWVEIVSAGLGSVEESNHVGYEITCAPESSSVGGIGGSGDLLGGGSAASRTRGVGGTPSAHFEGVGSRGSVELAGPGWKRHALMPTLAYEYPW